MSILITGNNGFIGSYLTEKLAEKNEKIIGFDFAINSNEDIRDEWALDKVFNENQVTEVIHLAALAGVRNGNLYPEKYISTNILGTWNICKMCEKYNVSHLIFYSSSSVYGNGNPPIKEVDECNPISLYGLTKLAGENIVKNCKVKQKTIVVPFTVYGKNGRKDEVVYRWLEQYKNNKPITVYGNGESSRGYVHIDDLVDITIKILKEKQFEWKCEKFNIGGAEIIKLKELVYLFKENIRDLKIDKLEMPELDIYENFADISKAKKLLGYNPEKKFVDIIKEIIKKELKN